MNLTPMETRIVEAIVAGPKTALELRDIAGCSSPEVLRIHLSRIRRKLPCGGIQSEARYVLSREAREAVDAALGNTTQQQRSA